MILMNLSVLLRHTLLVVVLLATASQALRASGSYMIRPVYPSAQRVEDSQKYELGKSIFMGKAALKESSGTDKSIQHARLAVLQERLPPRVRKTIDLTTLSGKLSAEQFAALQHFLKVRHKID
jgi:hypothetical protein